MLTDIINLVVETLGGLFGSSLLLRAYLQWLRLPPRNPLSEFVIALTNPVVLPLRRLIPGFVGIDWASLIAAYLTALLSIVVLVLVLNEWTQALAMPLTLLFLGGVCLIKWSLYLVMLLVVLFALLSWLNPYSPLSPVLNTLVTPFLTPLQRVLPRFGNVDLSPLVLMLVIQILLVLLRGLSLKLFGWY